MYIYVGGGARFEGGKGRALVPTGGRGGRATLVSSFNSIVVVVVVVRSVSTSRFVRPWVLRFVDAEEGWGGEALGRSLGWLG